MMKTDLWTWSPCEHISQLVCLDTNLNLSKLRNVTDCSGVLQRIFDVSLPQEHISSANSPQHPLECGDTFPANDSSYKSETGKNLQLVDQQTFSCFRRLFFFTISLVWSQGRAHRNYYSSPSLLHRFPLIAGGGGVQSLDFFYLDGLDCQRGKPEVYRLLPSHNNSVLYSDGQRALAENLPTFKKKKILIPLNLVCASDSP